MELDYRDAAIALSVFVVAVGLGVFAGDQLSSSEQSELYTSSVNYTINSDENRQTIEFDNRSVEIVFENWDGFRSYYDTGVYEESINTTSDGTLRTTTEVITVDGASYRFRFRYRDDPDGTEGDFLRLYRIERIQ